MLYRYAVSELGFGRSAPTIPVADGKPGEEVQVDTGWMTMIEPESPSAKRRRFRAWIFTPGVSRYRFAYPCLSETTESAIEACEAAWEFYGAVFGVMVVDNTRAIVHRADALAPRISPVFLEYAQARGFHVETTRVRSPQDKARVERSVSYVRDDCFGGETIVSIVGARERALCWCRGRGRSAPSLHHAETSARALRGGGEAGDACGARGALRDPAVGRPEGRP